MSDPRLALLEADGNQARAQWEMLVAELTTASYAAPAGARLRAAAPTGMVIQTADGATFVFDATLDEDYTLNAELTENPVDEGAPVTDHVRTAPLRLGFSCVVTNTPRVAADDPRAGALPQDLDIEGWRRLRAVLEARGAVTILTAMGEFPDMVLTRLSVNRTAEQGQAIEPRLEFTHVRFVAPQSVQLPQSRKLGPAVSAGGASKAEGGTQTTASDGGGSAAQDRARVERLQALRPR